MFMGFCTKQHYGQVLRELKNLGAVGNTNVLFNSNDFNQKETRHM
jgi:hypothetical protein